MTKEEKSKLMMEIRELITIANELSKDLENVHTEDVKRRDNVPSELLEHLGLAKEVENVKAVSESLKTKVLPEINAYYDTLEIKERKSRARPLEHFEVPEPLPERSNEHRSVRLQLLVSPSTSKKLASYCKKNGISKNELINRLLERAIISGKESN